MKKMFMVLPLVFLLCLTFACQQGEELAEEATVGIEVDVEAEQAIIAESLQNLVEAAVKGDTEKVKSFWHPQISWWDYTKEHPHGIDVWLKGFVELHNSDVNWLSCDAKPLEIHVVGNAAIL